MDTSHRSWSHLLLPIALSLFLGTTACDKKEEIPSSADKRVTTIAKTLPGSSTHMTAMFADLPKLGEGIERAKKSGSRVVPVDSLLENSVSMKGIGKFMGSSDSSWSDAKFWKERGIPPKTGAIGFARLNQNTAILAFVEDEKKFRKSLTDAIGADETESLSVAGQSATKSTSGTKAAWTVDGKLAVVTAEQPNADDPGDVTTTLKKILSAEPGDSVHATDGFSKYRDVVGSSPALVYLQPSVYLDSTEAGSSNFDEKTRKEIKKSLDGAGLDVEIEENRVTGRAWLGLTDKGRKRVDEWFKSPTKADWTNFVNEDLVLGLRMGGNWKNVFESYKSSLGEQRKKVLDTQLQMASSQLGMDVQKKLVGNMTGQSGLFVYGFGGKFSAQMMSRPSKALDNIRVAFVMKFANSKVLGNLADNISETAGDRVTVRPLKLGEDKTVRSIDAIDITLPKSVARRLPMGGALVDSGNQAAVRFYAHEDRLVAATTTIPEKTIHAMLTGKGSPTSSLADVDSHDLGAKFANGEELSGLYLNVVRARTILSDLLQAMPVQQINKAVQALREVMLSAEPKDEGMFIDLAVDMEPDAGSSGSGDGSKD